MEYLLRHPTTNMMYEFIIKNVGYSNLWLQILGKMRFCTVGFWGSILSDTPKGALWAPTRSTGKTGKQSTPCIGNISRVANETSSGRMWPWLIKNHQEPSKTIRNHQNPSEAIKNNKNHQKPPKTSKNHKFQDMLDQIKENQRLSQAEQASACVLWLVGQWSRRNPKA